MLEIKANWNLKSYINLMLPFTILSYKYFKFLRDFNLISTLQDLNISIGTDLSSNTTAINITTTPATRK